MYKNVTWTYTWRINLPNCTFPWWHGASIKGTYFHIFPHKKNNNMPHIGQFKTQN